MCCVLVVFVVAAKWWLSIGLIGLSLNRKHDENINRDYHRATAVATVDVDLTLELMTWLKIEFSEKAIKKHWIAICERCM